MKKLVLWFFFRALCLAPCLHAATNEVVTLAWDYPSAEVTNIAAFKVYQSEDVSRPLREWPLLTNVSGALQVSFLLEPGRHFFFVTASNFWGESDPSNVASTPALPRSGVVSIRRGN